MDISEKLKQARSKAGMTQEEVAEKAGVSRQTISNWETGKNYPDIVSLIALSDVYGVTLDSFLKGDIAMIKHLKESTNVTKSNKQVIATLIALAIFLFGNAFIIVAFGGSLLNFISLPTWLPILIPLLAVLTITRGFKLFYRGLRAAIFPKGEISEDVYGQAALLFRLLSKTTGLAAIISLLIGYVNMALGMDFSLTGGVAGSFIPNFAALLIGPLYSLMLIVFIFEPVVFILKTRNTN